MLRPESTTCQIGAFCPYFLGLGFPGGGLEEFVIRDRIGHVNFYIVSQTSAVTLYSPFNSTCIVTFTA